VLTQAEQCYISGARLLTAGSRGGSTIFIVMQFLEEVWRKLLTNHSTAKIRQRVAETVMWSLQSLAAKLWLTTQSIDLSVAMFDSNDRAVDKASQIVHNPTQALQESRRRDMLLDWKQEQSISFVECFGLSRSITLTFN